MKILYISLNSLVIDGWGYQENCLSKAHVKLGHEVTILTSHWIMDDKGKRSFDERNTYINEDGVKIVRLKMKGKEDYSRKFRRFIGLYESIVAERPDFIFIHSVNFVDIPVVVSYLKEHVEVKAVADNHADFSNTARNWVSKEILHGIIWKYYAQKLIPYVKKFYGVMPARVDFLKDVYGIPEEKTDLLVMGADDEQVQLASNVDKRNAIRNKYGIADDDILIMTGGKINFEKKQTITLMKVVNQLNNKKIKLIVFGSVIDELKTNINNQISDCSKYIGWVENRDTMSYYAAADLVVFPGRHSVFWEQVVGLGKPMVCKYWEGTTHVDLGGNVKFLYTDTEEELMQVICGIVDNKENYEEMRKVAKEKGMKEFSYLEIARKSLA